MTARSSHLGASLSALVDGELGHRERERVLAHLAGCPQCRVAAENLRRLKRRLAAMSDVAPPDALTARLHLMGEPGDPLPPRTSTSRAKALPRPGGSRRPSGRPRRRPRVRYLAAGVAAVAVLGIGTASYAMGGEPSTLPRVTPSVQQFAVQHAMTVGDLPDTEGGLQNVAHAAGHR